MLALLGVIPGILKAFLGFADTAKSISNDIAQVKIEALKSESDEKKIQAQEETKTLEARRDVLIAEAPGSRVNQLVRVLLSIPAIVLLWKIVIFDRVLGLGFTHKLSTEEWTYVWMVCGFYLLARTIQVARR